MCLHVTIHCDYQSLFSLREEINSFAANLLEWLEESLAKVPVALKEAKLEGQTSVFGN